VALVVFVERFLISTCALGITAPEESLTIPRTEPASNCAKIATDERRITTSKKQIV
jgi:hypothetical protein